MSFDTVIVVDWSAAKRAPAKPSKDAIWIGMTRDGDTCDPVYCRTRHEAEALITDLILSEQKANRRLLATFDFPFGYPKGFARKITGTNDPFALWDWFAEHIEDADDGANNRYDVAETLNGFFDGIGPFWGKQPKDRWPSIPYRKEGIVFDDVPEKRTCDHVAKASSSVFQMAFPPTVGGQIMMGLPVLNRLRRMDGVAVWPFEPWENAPVVLAEIWPGLIEPAVSAVQADEIRDRAQVRLLADALARLPAETLSAHMANVPPEASEEAWILGAGLDALSTSMRPSPPPLRDDCFALPAGVEWTPVDAALAHLKTGLSAVTAVEALPADQAFGRVLASDVVARRANPPLPNTAVDGYGFAGPKAEGAHVMPLAKGRAAAGLAFEGIVPDGHAIRILTGASLPEGVDTVILQEDVTAQDGQIAFHGPIKRGANTRNAGEDVKAGDLIARAGRRLTPADLALMAAVGVDAIDVRKPLRVGVLSTGDEVVSAGGSALAGQIYDANRPMLLGLIRSFGHVPVDLGIAPDDRGTLRSILDDAAGRTDAILTSGGASSGDEDHVSALLEDAGAMALWRIAVKPGRPLALGIWRGVPVFGLPGNPVAAMVCSLVFARPALDVLAGAQWSDPQGFDVPAAFEKSKKAGRREYLRARMRDGMVEVFASEGSGRISGLSWAEGLVELPDGAMTIKRGDLVRYIPFGSFGV